MRMLILCYEYPPIGGGGAKVVYGLTDRLSELGYQVDLVTMRYKNLKPFEKNNNLNIYRVKCLRLKANLCTPIEMATYIVSAIFLVIKLCRKNNYKINHTHFIFPDGVLAYVIYKIFGLPYVITAHGSDVPGYNPNRFKMLHYSLVLFWKKIVKNSAKVICASKSIQDLVLRVEKSADTELIPNGINLKKFSPYEVKKKQILFVSRMFERKGVQYFLNALQGLNHCFQVYIVGDGPYLENLKKLSEQLGLNVFFLGYVDNNSIILKNLYETSMIFVFTSESENFPIVLLEAMTAGLAIITTNETGCSEVTGDTAILVQPKDSAAIRTALVKLMDDEELCLKIGMAARHRVVEKFSWEASVEKHISLYNKIIN